jgi:hypothetical protein
LENKAWGKYKKQIQKLLILEKIGLIRSSKNQRKSKIMPVFLFYVLFFTQGVVLSLFDTHKL